MEAKLEVTNLITPLLKTFKLLGDEWKNLFKEGLSNYLHSQTSKYYFTTTFIHRTEVRFDDIYFPLNAKYKALTTDFQDLNAIFEENKNITLIGSAGSGKTTLMKYIFLNSIRTSYKVPLLIELRYLNQYNGDFEKLICEKILKSEISPSEDILRRALASGKFIFLLDGYDEIFSIRKQEINKQIEDFLDRYSENNFIITTRPGSGIEGFRRFKDFKVEPLSKKQVEGFIDKIVGNEERKQRILNVINDKASSQYLHYLTNPLLLSMFIIAFENHPEIPSRKSSFYRNVFDTLYSKHDGITKNSFPREKLTKFDRDQFERVLNVFSYLTIINGKYSFTHELLNDTLKTVISNIGFNCKIDDLIFDLQTTISILILDGFEYFFPHRSMQEYFAAQFLSILPSDAKGKAYQNLNDAFIKSGTDNSFNLWGLSLELDESSFKKLFLIPQLRIVEQKLSANNDIDLINSFLSLCDYSMHCSYGSEPEKRQFMMVRNQPFTTRLLKFCNVIDTLSLSGITQTPDAREELLIIYEKINFGKKPSRSIDFSEDIIQVLIKYGCAKILNDLVKKTRKTIEIYEEDLLNSKSRLDDLLNL